MLPPESTASPSGLFKPESKVEPVPSPLGTTLTVPLA
jgi:hypothetical protein